MTNENLTKAKNNDVKKREGKPTDGTKLAEQDAEFYNLKCNLLLLRETYRVLNSAPSSYQFNTFYKALNLYDEDDSRKTAKRANDVLNKFWQSSILSKPTHALIADALDKTSLPQEYYRYSRAVRIRLNSKIDDALHKYFHKDIGKAQKESTRLFIDSSIYELIHSQDSEINRLVLACYELSVKTLPSNKSFMWRASETLDKILQCDFTDDDMDSGTFYDFITNVAKTVNKIEDSFPAFYAVAQQLKTEKNTQSIMNEITNSLNQLRDIGIQKEDAQSASCLNLMGSIAETMTAVQKALAPETK